MICKLANPEPDIISACTTQKAIFLCFTHPRARYQESRTIPIPIAQNSIKLLKPDRPKLYILFCLALPWEISIKRLAQMIPWLLSSAPDHPCVYPCGPSGCAMPLASRPSEYNELWSFFLGLSFISSCGHTWLIIRKGYITNRNVCARHKIINMYVCMHMMYLYLWINLYDIQIISMYISIHTLYIDLAWQTAYHSWFLEI